MLRNTRSMSEIGIRFLKNAEGLRLNAYQCSAGKWTIGYGHTKGVTAGMKITKEQADIMFQGDREYFESAVSRHIDPKILGELTQGQFDALVSIAFNIGLGAFSTSTLLRKVNSGDLEGAIIQFRRWVYAKGKRVNGLERRRNAEINQLWKGTH